MKIGIVLSAVVYAVMGLYFVGVVVTRHQRKSKNTLAGVYSLLLLVLGLLLLVFANERLTGIFEHLTNVIRTDARIEGWYNTRREMQVTVLRDSVVSAAVVFALLLMTIRRSFARNFLFAAAFAYYLIFAAVQLISLHQTDAVLNHRFDSVAGIHWLDAVGMMLCLLAVGTAAGLNRHTRKKNPFPKSSTGLSSEQERRNS